MVYRSACRGRIYFGGVVSTTQEIISVAYAEGKGSATWEHVVEPNTGALIIDLVLEQLPGRWDDPARFVRTSQVRVGDSNAVLVKIVPGDRYDNASREVWGLLDLPAGTVNVKVVGLVDVNGKAVDRRIAARSLTLDPSVKEIAGGGPAGDGDDFYEGGRLTLGLSWLKNYNKTRIMEPMARRSAMIQTSSSARLSRPSSVKMESEIVAVRSGFMRRQRKIQKFRKITKLVSTLRAVEAWRAWRASGDDQ